jgi:SAM-dependent methyltransferase
MSALSVLKSFARVGRAQLERHVYRGDAVACNVCGGTSRSWLRGTRCGRCPQCRCATRTRVLWWFLAHRATTDGARILHFAPEPPLEQSLRKLGSASYVTTDFRNPRVTVQADIQALPFGDSSFDLVLCSHVLEHIRDDHQAMRELRRVCSAGGQVLIMVPMSDDAATREDLSDLPPKVRQQRFGEIDHLREYGRDLVDQLRDAGFAVSPFEPAVEIGEADRVRHGLDDRQTIFICTR